MKRIARVVASKWFAAPLCVLPFFILANDYFSAIRLLESEPPPSIRKVSLDENDTVGNSSTSSVEFADFAFSVPDEDFLEATGRTPDSPTSGDSNKTEERDDFSFSVSEDEFQSATQTLENAKGEDTEELIARKMSEEATDIRSGANLNERFLHETGDVAIAYFIIVLCLTPLRRLFSKAAIVSALNRHRRLVGLTAFFYASLHLVLYFDDGLNRLVEEWNLFYIQCGLASFLTMLALAATSNTWAVRKLGGKRWKNLHRLLYLAIPALLYHKGWSGKATPDQVREVLFWFLPMLLLQFARVMKHYSAKKRKSSA